ncbi:MAG: diguanylate cyclase, partial [Oscillospiraceae bacterium]|nr:diguanylate cyclase [Oscillospiraceae bacterium]
SGGKFDDFTISVSMGVATTEMVGYSYDTLFHAADQALYTVKRGGRGRCCFYDQSMADTLSAISPIDGGEARGEHDE